MRQLLRLYPLALTGNLALGGSIYLLGLAYATRNAYALLFGLLGLVILGAIIVFVYVQYALYRLAELRIIERERLVARKSDSRLWFAVSGVRPMPFFRLHVGIRGHLHAGRSADLSFALETVCQDGTESLAEFVLFFPVAGEIEGTTQVLIRDIFLLTRIQLNAPMHFKTVVVPPPVPDPVPLRFEMQFNAETGQRKSVAEEEKYYMREYIPGDRPKDINWKASARVQELITRISPYSPERTYIICLELRNIAPGREDSPLSIMHLNYLKSWLLSFMLQVHRENPAFQFFLRSARSSCTLRNETEIEAYVPELARITYQEEWERQVASTHQEKFIFTTIFDHSLLTYLAESARIRCNVFRTTAMGKDARLIHFYPPSETSVRPAFWFLRRSPPRRTQKGPAVMWMDNPLKVSIF
ncbi:MAG: DUF58 domain-containing protein [Spirochaetales bacterium]|nr:DUF58 domain-containing protein [Spirochaetales bacterium]